MAPQHTVICTNKAACTTLWFGFAGVSNSPIVHTVLVPHLVPAFSLVVEYLASCTKSGVQLQKSRHSKGSHIPSRFLLENCVAQNLAQRLALQYFYAEVLQIAGRHYESHGPMSAPWHAPSWHSQLQRNLTAALTRVVPCSCWGQCDVERRLCRDQKKDLFWDRRGRMLGTSKDRKAHKVVAHLNAVKCFQGCKSGLLLDEEQFNSS